MEYLWDFFWFPESIIMKSQKQSFGTFQPLGNSFYTLSNIRIYIFLFYIYFFSNPEFSQNIRFLECSHTIHRSIHILIAILKKLWFTGL